MKRLAPLAACLALALVAVGAPAADSFDPTLSLSESSPYEYVSGTTLYYSSTAPNSGSFSVTASDPAGITSVDFPSVFGDDPVSGASSSHTYSWTSGASDSGTKTVTDVDGDSTPGSATFGLKLDTNAPTGVSATLVGGPAFTTLSVPLTLNAGADAAGEAGLDPNSEELWRATATLTGTTCGTFAAPVKILDLDAPLPASLADGTVATGNCYQYLLKSSDNVGNQATSAPSATAQVSGTGPTVTDTAPTEVSGAGDQFWNSTTDTLWFRPAATGSFALNATSTDSTLTGVAFPDVSAIAGWTGSTGGTDSTAPYSSPVVYKWTAGATAPGAQKVTATNSAALTAFDTITIGADSVAPTGQAVTLTGGPWFGASVPLAITAGTDVSSGVDASRAVVERASAPMTNGVCGTFGTFAPVTLSGNSDASVLSGNCYRYQVKATDNVGNVSGASAASADAKIDKTAPTTPALLFSGFSNSAASGNVVYFRPGATGSFTITAAASDPESGITSYSFPSVPGFTIAGTGPHRTYVSAKTGSTATGPLTVSATNSAGVSSGVASFSLVPDAAAPALRVRCNGAACQKQPYAKTAMVTLTASDLAGSGVSTIRWTSDGSDPRVDHGNQYVRGIPVRGVTHLKARAFDKAGNASALVNLTVRSLASRLVVGVPTGLVVKAKGSYVQARLSSTRRALVSATMSGTGLKKALHWHFVLASGTSVVQLRLPKTIRRPGSYRVVWTLSADTRRAQKTTRVTLR